MMTAMKKHLAELNYPAPRTVSKLVDQVSYGSTRANYFLFTLSLSGLLILKMAPFRRPQQCRGRIG